MEKLYKHDSLYDDVFAGKYTLLVMFCLVLVIYLVPWDKVYLVTWFNALIEFQSQYFPNINKIRDQLGSDRSNYFVAQQAFLNIIEWPIFLYVLYRIKPADKVITGEFTRVYFVLIMGAIIIFASLYVMTSAGTTGGKLIGLARQTDFGLTIAKVLCIWGGFFGWVAFFSILLGLKIKWKNKG